MKNYQTLLAIIIGISLASCAYNVEEELYPTLECSTDDVTYSGAVLTIMQNKCLGCHNNAVPQGNITLEGHDNMKKYVDNGELLGSIRFDPGYSAMPKNQSKMVDCDIEKIEVWVAQGALNN